jgi:hypothetical protein
MGDNIIIEPSVLLSTLANYIERTKRILEITEEEAIRHVKCGSQGRFPLEPVVRSLRDTNFNPDNSYYARFHSGEDGEIESLHHGWCFDFFATAFGREVTLLHALRFADTPEGLLSAFFVSVLLPTIGAFWHGLYERDYQIIVSQNKLREIVQNSALKITFDNLHTVHGMPLGLRVVRMDGDRSCRCLCHSETEGLLDVEFVISKEGRASEAVRNVLCEPEGMTFY